MNIENGTKSQCALTLAHYTLWDADAKFHTKTRLNDHAPTYIFHNSVYTVYIGP